jgi:sulfur-oxidizing protein SoxX
MSSERNVNAAGGLASMLLLAGLALSTPARGTELSMARPPGVEPGDSARGRALVADRQKGLCLLCHSAPVGDLRQQGNLAPSLDGAGGRLDEAQLRLRIHDSRRINPESIMPAYGVADPAPQVAAAWRGKPIFTAQQIEDVVAWLVTLK